jgi:hypothetical protein
MGQDILLVGTAMAWRECETSQQKSGGRVVGAKSQILARNHKTMLRKIPGR